MRVVALTFMIVLVLAGLTLAVRASSSDQLSLNVPLGIPTDFWRYCIPANNQLTPAKIELGRRLFFDQRLSADNSVSCSSCHDPQLAFADGKKTAVGIGGRHGARNSPSILNAMFNSTMFWDGRVDSLEAQAREPLINPDEMGNASHDQLIKKLTAIPEYNEQFQIVFGGPVDLNSLSKAIAAYERTLLSANAPFDRFLAGDRKALSEAAQRGFNLFRTKARCSVCHSLNQSFPFFTDGNYRNTGVAANFGDFPELSRRATALSLESSSTLMSVLDKQKGKAELGRFITSGNALDIGAFRTPSLRNVELTAPYFHDGSAGTLADVVRYYVKGGNENASRDWELQAVGLSDQEQKDLIEFLKSLTSDDAKQAVKN
jgi:cytochrome c peroxidase